MGPFTSETSPRVASTSEPTTFRCSFMATCAAMVWSCFDVSARIWDCRYVFTLVSRCPKPSSPAPEMGRNLNQLVR